MKAITTKYRGARNDMGSHIYAYDMDGNSTTISYPHELSGDKVHQKAALALCAKMGWHGTLATGQPSQQSHTHVFVIQHDCCHTPPKVPGRVEVCTECGGDEIHVTAWVDLQTGLNTGDEGPLSEAWCVDCGEHTRTIRRNIFEARTK